MKKHQLDHILRAAGDITRQKQFVIVGSQALHAKRPDLVDDIVSSAEVDLFAPRQRDARDLLKGRTLREREREIFTCIFICIYSYTH